MFATYSYLDSVLTLHSTPPVTLSLPHVSSLFSLPSHGIHNSIIGVTPDMSVIHVHISDTRILSSSSCKALPISSPPIMIIPVDPMGWTEHQTWSEQAILLSVSKQGDLEFWSHEVVSTQDWKCIGRISTGRTNLKLAVCSSAKKSALGIFLSCVAVVRLSMKFSCPTVWWRRIDYMGLKRV
jgi:hypothetical protein